MEKQIGQISVDAGLCWIGDPCYILHKNKKETPKSLGKNWSGFCDLLDTENNSWQFKHDGGFEGLGVVVSTGYGDGVYPVYAEEENGRVKEIRIKFF